VQKLTVLYCLPKDTEAFAKYYKENHMPLVGKLKGVDRTELTKFMGTADGPKRAYYRMAELYFSDMDQLQKTMSSPQGEATASDLEKFATGGAQVMVGSIESE